MFRTATKELTLATDDEKLDFDDILTKFRFHDDSSLIKMYRCFIKLHKGVIRTFYNDC